MTDRMENMAGPVEARVYRSASPEETLALGEAAGANVPPGTALSLEGGLGAGKTFFVKGMARGLGISSEVLSPTFILVEEYRGGNLPVFHFDLYRLEDIGDVEKAGLFDAIDGTNIVIVEWGDRLPAGAVDFDVKIRIKVTGERSREITVTAPSSLHERMPEGKIGS
jgi:tRNA threonylcarbamoyladenosine biosynthesis protein TsaE